jgi:ATP-dependent protease ClpP protease subunit
MREILIYDEIGPDFWGLVSAKSFLAELDRVPGDEQITVRINSPGGDMNEAGAIYNAIARRGGVTIAIDALAASAASYLAMAGDKIQMAANAVMMIHEPWTIAIGNAEKLRGTADVLDKFAGIAADVYAKRSGQELAAVKDMLASETWLTAEEALAKGFTDEVLPAVEVQANIRPKQFAKQPELLNRELPNEDLQREIQRKLSRFSQRLELTRRRVAA